MTVGVAKMFLAIHYLTSENGKPDELVTYGAFEPRKLFTPHIELIFSSKKKKKANYLI